MEEDIRNKIRSYLGRSLKNKEFGNDDDLFKMGLLHSLFAIQLIVFIEKHFNIELDGEDVSFEKIRTVNDLVRLVSSKHCVSSMTAS